MFVNRIADANMDFIYPTVSPCNDFKVIFFWNHKAYLITKIFFNCDRQRCIILIGWLCNVVFVAYFI